MAIDPERIRQRAREAEESGRRCLDAQEGHVALRALAVMLDDEACSSSRELQGEAELVRAS